MIREGVDQVGPPKRVSRAEPRARRAIIGDDVLALGGQDQRPDSRPRRDKTVACHALGQD